MIAKLQTFQITHSSDIEVIESGGLGSTKELVMISPHAGNEGGERTTTELWVGTVGGDSARYEP